ncbi:MAG: hypothetical protein E7439_02265 [Ruminococcaceae bacterium]|nr:hypothetical protein [Oscillospiraceae bacterium]
MKLTENIDAHISAYEQEKGEIINPQVVELIKKMAAVADRFDELGAMDAAAGRTQRTKKAFIEWGRRNLNDPEGKDNSIVDLMYRCYLDGYNAGKAAV